MSIKTMAAVSLVAGASYFAGYVFGRGSTVNFSGDSSALCVFGQDCSTVSDNLYSLFDVIKNIGEYSFYCFGRIALTYNVCRILSDTFQSCKRIGSNILSNIGPHFLPGCSVGI